MRERQRHVPFRDQTETNQHPWDRVTALFPQASGACQIRVSELTSFLQEDDDARRDGRLRPRDKGFVPGSITSCGVAFGGKLGLYPRRIFGKLIPPGAAGKFSVGHTGRSNFSLSAMNGLPDRVYRIGLRAVGRGTSLRYQGTEHGTHGRFVTGPDTGFQCLESARQLPPGFGIGPRRAMRILGCAVSARSYDS